MATAARRGACLLISVASAVAVASCSDSPTETGEVIAFGTVRSVDGGTIAGLEGRLQWDNQSIRIDFDGSGFTVTGSEPPPSTSFLSLEPTAHVPAWIPLEPADLDGSIDVILFPSSWTIEGGAHAGDRVPLRPGAAADSRVMPSFWRVHFPFAPATVANPIETIVDSTIWTGVFRTWPASAFPIPLALDHQATTADIEPTDSANVWGAVAELEHAFGRDLFEPAELSDVEAVDFNGLRTGRGGVLLRYDSTRVGRASGSALSMGAPVWVVNRPTPWSGHSVERISFGSVDIEGGLVLLRDVGATSDTALVMHELLHTLGLGHGCSWMSIMSLTRCGLESSTPTEDDVAYYEALEAMRSIEQTFASPWGTFAAIMGDRAVNQRLPALQDPRELSIGGVPAGSRPDS